MGAGDVGDDVGARDFVADDVTLGAWVVDIACPAPVPSDPIESNPVNPNVAQAAAHPASPVIHP